MLTLCCHTVCYAPMPNLIGGILFYGQVKVETKVILGDPKEKICEFVENLQADLLVVGSRAFGPIKRYRFRTS
jgi:nucleotide-binding universal stress UspA family protein